MIDDRITITVLEIGPNGGIKLGIDAPREVPVHRYEVWEESQFRAGIDDPAPRNNQKNSKKE